MLCHTFTPGTNNVYTLFKPLNSEIMKLYTLFKIQENHTLLRVRPNKAEAPSPTPGLDMNAKDSTAVKRLSMRAKLPGDRIVRFEKPCMWL